MKKTTPTQQLIVPSEALHPIRQLARGGEDGCRGDGSTESKASAPDLERLEREKRRTGKEPETVGKQQREEGRSEG
jgi:hypothetical protein